MPDTLLRPELTEHLRQVQAVTDAGIPPPRAWTELADRFTRYRRMPLTGAQRLAAALVHPTKGDDLGWLHALALAEAAATVFPPIQAQVDNTVAGIIEPRLCEL
jgi:hypothetical protein